MNTPTTRLADSDNPSLRDPEFIRRVAHPVLEAIGRSYFRVEFRGMENVPADGHFLCVGNHSGAPLLPDVFMLIPKWWSTFGVERPAYAMVHDLPFLIPGVRELLVKLGGLRASRENALRVLQSGATLLAYPGGEQEVMRHFRNRDRIDFRGRTGFVRLALETGSTLLPVVNVGGHEVYVTLLSSRRLARWTGLEALTGLKTFTLNLGLPWGVWATSVLPYWPLPTRIVYQIGKPFSLPKDLDLARDHDFVTEVGHEVVRAMQSMLDDLAAERRFPVIG